MDEIRRIDHFTKLLSDAELAEEKYTEKLEKIEFARIDAEVKRLTKGLKALSKRELQLVALEPTDYDMPEMPKLETVESSVPIDVLDLKAVEAYFITKIMARVQRMFNNGQVTPINCWTIEFCSFMSSLESLMRSDRGPGVAGSIQRAILEYQKQFLFELTENVKTYNGIVEFYILANSHGFPEAGGV